MCSKPFRKGGEEFGCGQCMPCRFNRRRLWTARLMLEAHQHEASFFLTLTFNKENYPADGSVSVREAQLFLKRLRYFAGQDFRYFIVGEYGDATWRPHYHACVFGLRDAVAIERAWQKGFVHVLPLTYELAQYCVGYTVKKLTKADDERLKGRCPEFARMSLKPGIGFGSVKVMRDALIDMETGEIRMAADVPASVRADGKLWPIGRYLRRGLRCALGMDAAESAAARAERRAGEELRWPSRHLQKELDPKEQKRLQVARRVAALSSISRTKRGL